MSDEEDVRKQANLAKGELKTDEFIKIFQLVASRQ
jgi:hypothetical protein